MTENLRESGPSYNRKLTYRNRWSEETNWQYLSDAVAALKREVERAYYESRDDDAGATHDDLTAAEWRLRQAERRNVK